MPKIGHIKRENDAHEDTHEPERYLDAAATDHAITLANAGHLDANSKHQAGGRRYHLSNHWYGLRHCH